MAPPQPDLDVAEAAGSAVQPEEAAPVSRLGRLRVLALAATSPLITGYAAVAAVLALVTAVTPFAHFSTEGVLGAALPGWLAANQVPIAVGGVEFGVLPLLPTIGVMLLAARAAAGAAERLGLTSPREAVQVVGSVAAAHGVCGLLVALFYSGRFVDVDPLAALYYPGLLAALAATAGVMRRCGLAGALASRADEVAMRGLAAGLIAVALLLAAGAAVFTFGLLTSIPAARELFVTSAPGAGNGIGMLLLCLGYLPNAVVAGTAFVAGPGFALGEVSLSLLGFSGGRVLGVPLLAALPEEQAAWWPVLFLLPVAVGVLVGRRLRYAAERPLARMRAVAVAGGVVALAFAVIAGSAGGRLGAGAFDPVTMRAAPVSLALVVAVAIPGAVVAWLGGPRPHYDLGPGLIPDQEPEADSETDLAGEPEREPGAGRAAEPDGDPEGEAGAEPAAGTDGDLEAGPETDLAAEPDGDPEREPGAGRAAQPDGGREAGLGAGRVDEWEGGLGAGLGVGRVDEWDGGREAGPGREPGAGLTDEPDGNLQTHPEPEPDAARDDRRAGPEAERATDPQKASPKANGS